MYVGTSDNTQTGHLFLHVLFHPFHGVSVFLASHETEPSSQPTAP